MPPIVIYKCAVCRMQRESYEAAERCEKSHLSAISVRELEYVLGAYPYRIAVMFPDGHEREYIADEGVYVNGGNHEKHKDKRNRYDH